MGEILLRVDSRKFRECADLLFEATGLRPPDIDADADLAMREMESLSRIVSAAALNGDAAVECDALRIPANGTLETWIVVKPTCALREFVTALRAGREEIVGEFHAPRF